MTAAVEAPIDPPRAAPTAVRRDFTTPRLVYWSLRRELWEHRSIVWAPVIVAGLMLLGFAVGANRIVGMMDAVSVLDVVQQGELLVKPLAFTAIPLLITVSLVAMFYCLDALHGERRDRSILFWKSLPVSDVVTVASKALVPLVVLPVIACVTFLVMQLLILLIGSGVLLAHGLDGALPWRGLPVLRTWGGLTGCLVGLALWHAPIYGWLLLVSGWARRSTFLWAVLPPLGLCLVERIAFDTAFAWSLLKDRLFGFPFQRLLMPVHGGSVDPVAPFARPDLWVGLLVAGLLLAAAIGFRRYRQPV